MQTPLFNRPLTEDERHQIQTGLRSKDAFVLRRALGRLRTNGIRARHWITSPDPQYLLKKVPE